MIIKNTHTSTRPAIWTGQNFIREKKIVKHLLSLSNISKNDCVIEIGPGKGAITKYLSHIAKQVIGIEVDQHLANALNSELADLPNVQIITADFLSWQPPQYYYKVFANIPFAMTADIIKKLTKDSYFQSGYLIVQDKAALRFAPKKIQTQIAILLAPIFAIKIISKIKRFAFSPIPKVNIVLLEIIRRKKPLIAIKDYQEFCNFVVYGYNRWQPNIMLALKQIFTQKQRQQLATKLKLAKTKPSQLTFAQWQQLFALFKQQASLEKKKIIAGAYKKLIQQQQKLQKIYRTR